jgi:hypothetical protein
MFAASAFDIPLSGATTASSVASDGFEVSGACAGIGVLTGPTEVVRDAAGIASIGPVGFSVGSTLGVTGASFAGAEAAFEA